MTDEDITMQLEGETDFGDTIQGTFIVTDGDGEYLCDFESRKEAAWYMQNRRRIIERQRERGKR